MAEELPPPGPPLFPLDENEWLGQPPESVPDEQADETFDGEFFADRDESVSLPDVTDARVDAPDLSIPDVEPVEVIEPRAPADSERVDLTVGGSPDVETPQVNAGSTPPPRLRPVSAASTTPPRLRPPSPAAATTPPQTGFQTPQATPDPISPQQPDLGGELQLPPPGPPLESGDGLGAPESRNADSEGDSMGELLREIREMNRTMTQMRVDVDAARDAVEDIRDNGINVRA